MPEKFRPNETGKMASFPAVSLAIATKVEEGVVLCADTRITLHFEGANYAQDGYCKMRLFGEGAAVAVTGDVPTVMGYLERAEEQGKAFRQEIGASHTVRELQLLFRKFYRDEIGDKPDPNATTTTTLLFAGSGVFANKKETFIFRMELNHNFDYSKEPRFALAGQHNHGGLYYHTRFLREGMSAKEAAFLAYWCIGEVGSVDGRVGG